MKKNNLFQLIGLIILLFLSTKSFSQSIAVSKELLDELVAIRNYLYNHPEASGQERETALYVANYLEQLGLEVKTNIGGYGVVGILNGGKKGKRIAWRADMDAICKSTYTSKTEEQECAVAHICGHDVHTTMALGIAKVLANQKDEIEGSVYFIFQPSEENWKGAKTMIADGLFDVIQPDEIYGAHVSPMPVGLIASKPNYIYADYKQINLTFKKIKDTEALLSYVKSCFSQIQTVAQDSEFWQMQNLLRPDIGIGNQNTIFKNYITVEDKFVLHTEEDTVTISAYVSASNSNLMEAIPDQLRKKITASSYGKKLDQIMFSSNQFAYSQERGNINNSSDLFQKVMSFQNKNSNKNFTFLPLYGVIPGGRGDDFAYFQEEVPGVYFLIGGSNFDNGIIAMPHDSNFKLDENIIKVGVEGFSSLLLHRIKE